MVSVSDIQMIMTGELTADRHHGITVRDFIDGMLNPVFRCKLIERGLFGLFRDHSIQFIIRMMGQ